MSKHYADWTDWAGDHPIEAEADLNGKLRAEMDADGRAEADEAVRAELYGCGHTEVYATGHCADCGTEVEGFEPSDAQIPGTYDIGKAAA